jgi:hypothetical protein
MLRYFREEDRLESHRRLLARNDNVPESPNDSAYRSRDSSFDKFPRLVGISPENDEEERFRYLRLTIWPINSGISSSLKSFELKSR